MLFFCFLFLENADKIEPSSVEVEVMNETSSVRLRWAEPTITNGPILTYVVQYRRMDENVGTIVN